jgi:hypothetical protein
MYKGRAPDTKLETYSLVMPRTARYSKHRRFPAGWREGLTPM